MKVMINPDQGSAVDQVSIDDILIGKEPTEVTATQGKTLLQLQNKRGSLVVKVSGKPAASDNEVTETEEEAQS